MTAPKHLTGRSIRRWMGMAGLCAIALTALTGCPKPAPPPKPMVKYSPIPPDPNMPAFLKGTIKEMTVTANTGSFPVSSWGLVTELRHTGDTTAPSVVREWMLKEMLRHGLGRSSLGYKDITPEQMLADPSVAIVAVVGNIPPGARKGDYVDVAVQAMPGNNTTSLANGKLWRTSLRINGATSSDPEGAVNEYAKAQGNIFVNPAYALSSATTQSTARASLRAGLIPNGGIVTTDRAIHLMLRNPSWAGSQVIERRLDQLFQNIADMPKKTGSPRLGVAEAQDEGYIHLYLPKAYQGSWQHFLGVATHAFMNTDAAFAVTKARQLGEEALKPDAALMDISYCWEAIGPQSIPFITPLLTNPQQKVQYAAARAAAFLGDQFGEDTLVQIARTPNHEFQVNAVQTLGELPNSPQINANLATLLDAGQSLVRIEAYKVLAAHADAHIFSKIIHSKQNPENEFVLDLIASNGPPLIYCTRIGQPRVAIFGRKVSMQTPATFSAFDSRLTIATLPDRPRTLNIYYRDEARRNPVEAISGPDVGELVARLGGLTDEGFRFTYGDVVAILQAMVEKQKVAAAFVLQQMPNAAAEVREAPALPDQSRPQADAGGSSQVGASLPDLRPEVAPQKPRPNDPNNSSRRPQ